MVGITRFTSLSSNHLGSRASQPLAASGEKNVAATVTDSSTRSTVSTLARQLSEAAAHAEARDAGLSSMELGQKASALLAQLMGEGDAGLPNTDDPERLARADQANRFISGSASNPFTGLPRDQLSLIAYDDSGTFTLNERRAAWAQANIEEQAWRQHVAAQARDEYSHTGKLTTFFSQVRDHHAGLPAIEQAQYPEDYAGKLQQLIALDFDWTRSGNDPVDLIEQFVAAGSFAHQGMISTASPPATPVLATPPASTTRASTSAGYQLMVSRLFGGKEPAVGNAAEGMSMSNIGRSPYEFLTREDRALLAEMYAYAQDEGVDLAHLDFLAYDIGSYRQHNNGRLMLSFNSGHSYDAEGRQVFVSFDDKDAATASRILSGTAINSTRLDQGFLRYILDPGFGALTVTSDLEFLEWMVSKFSGRGETTPSLGEKFAATYTPVSPSQKAVFHASEDVRLAPFEPHVTNVNGVWTVTEKGKAAGMTLDQVTGQSRRSAASPADQELNRYVLDLLLHKKEPSDSRPIWLTKLLERLQHR
ncbi:MAG TPA: hypothetical protein VL178_14845 [Pseudomonas sp.]|nr:hypothetical protein [Pseudomonas sp.]